MLIFVAQTSLTGSHGILGYLPVRYAPSNYNNRDRSSTVTDMRVRIEKRSRMQPQLRPQTAKLVCRLLAPLLDHGVVTAAELSIIRRNLNSLAKDGELAHAEAPRFIDGPKAASMLDISYSQFRSLEKEGAFPFERRVVGKSVRYVYAEIVDYMLVGSLQGEDAGGSGDDV